MTYISLFINPSDAIGYELNNIPWLGLNLKKDKSLYCNKPNRRLVVDDNGNVTVVDDVQPMSNNEIWYTTPTGKKLYTYNNQEYTWKELIEELDNIKVLGPKIISENFDNITGMYKMIFDDNVTDIGIIGANPLTTYVTFTSLLGARCNANLIILPDNVINIRRNAFYLNQNLTTITIPNSVIDVSNYAFAGCKNMTNITIGRSVSNLADNVLMDEPDISERQYTGSLQTITVVNGLTYNYNGSEYFPITLANGTNVTLHMWNREDEPDDVNVTIDGELVTLDGNLSYADNDYDTLYSQNTYDSSEGESASDYEIDTSNTYPQEGDEYWTECNDSSEELDSFIFYIEDSEGISTSYECDENMAWSQWFGDPNYNTNNYETLYTSNSYDSDEEEIPEVASSDYPQEGVTYYDYCNDTAEHETTTSNFYIEDSTGTQIIYECEEGMSWQDWFRSEYNTAEYTTLYTSNSYNSDLGESASDYEINESETEDGPHGDSSYYDYCDDIGGGGDEPEDYVTVYVNDAETTYNLTDDVNLYDANNNHYNYANELIDGDSYYDNLYYLNIRVKTDTSEFSISGSSITIGIGKLDEKSTLYDLNELIKTETKDRSQIGLAGNTGNRLLLLTVNGVWYGLENVITKTPITYNTSDLNEIRLFNDFFDKFNYEHGEYYIRALYAY